MGQFHRMSEQLQAGVCQGCFSFRGIESRPDPSFPKSTDPVEMPICASTQQPLVGYCTKTIRKPSAASMRGNPTTVRTHKAKKVFIGKREVEQATFTDYIRQLKRERGARVG